MKFFSALILAAFLKESSALDLLDHQHNYGLAQQC